ncbi:trypsin-like peptidase domain-containing protein [Deinococcus multiflagellatus]|uniref:Trypsin-like peptidase domain-containing protein n=1 Tax=Deinococcus multiflagellatus TaxID=1656887 RepID=A0ABW1ZIF8_9DEIO
MTLLTDLSSALADAVQAAAPSLVTVLAARPVSGTVVASGQVLTVAHLLHTDDVTILGADGQSRSAVVAGRDPSTDLALLRVEGLDAPALAPGAEVRVGELLLAVGRPSSGLQATLGFMERLPQPGEAGCPRAPRPSGALVVGRCWGRAGAGRRAERGRLARRTAGGAGPARAGGGRAAGQHRPRAARLPGAGHPAGAFSGARGGAA